MRRSRPAERRLTALSLTGQARSLGKTRSVQADVRGLYSWTISRKQTFRFPPQSWSITAHAGQPGSGRSKLPIDRPLPSDFSSLRQQQCVFDVDAEIADGVLDLRVAEQDLNCTNVTRGAVNHRCFRPPK